MKTPALLLLLLGLVAHTSAVDIIGHRGASHDAPENTLAAFKLGWEQGADAVELDIWLTKDGKIVCLHDADTKRTTGVLKKVAESTLDELRTLDAGIWKDAKWRGEKLPTLAEALAAIPAGKRLVIEIKAGVEILPELARDLKAAGKPDGQLVIISFKHDVCRGEAALPEDSRALSLQLQAGQVDRGVVADRRRIDSKAKSAGLDGINLSYKGPLDAAFVNQTHAAGLKFYVWTVNDPEIARKLVAAGADGITTDRPGWLRGQLR